jgi:hypothetical protein
MKDLVASLLAGVAVLGGFAGIVCVAIAASTALWYYLVNFALSAFNTGYEITWIQALAVCLVAMVVSRMLKSIFRESKE